MGCKEVDRKEHWQQWTTGQRMDFTQIMTNNSSRESTLEAGAKSMKNITIKKDLTLIKYWQIIRKENRPSKPEHRVKKKSSERAEKGLWSNTEIIREENRPSEPEQRVWKRSPERTNLNSRHKTNTDVLTERWNRPRWWDPWRHVLEKVSTMITIAMDRGCRAWI